MIQDRPNHLLADPAYRSLPPLPYAVDWTSVPEFIRLSMLDLGGVQPVTAEVARAAGGKLRDTPSEGEVELFRERGTSFQMISVVVSLVAAGSQDGCLRGKPFALTLIPASKRGEVHHCTIDFVDKVDVTRWLETEPAYAGYDPFSGDWSIYGGLGTLMHGQPPAWFLDEIGLVVSQFFLATQFDANEVLAPDVGMPTKELAQKYQRHRTRLLFTPFDQVKARRVWGAESPIELFLLQELARRDLYPQLQMLIMEDGSVFPSLYDLWQDLEFRHTPGLITEADLFFPERRVAVFCDGAHHSRGKQRERDDKINARLDSLGITAVRVPGRVIINDLKGAADRVTEAL